MNITSLLMLLVIFVLLYTFYKTEEFNNNINSTQNNNINQDITIDNNIPKKVTFSDENNINLFDYNEPVLEINNNIVIQEPMVDKFENWGDQIKNLYPLQDNPYLGLTIPESSNDKFKFNKYDDNNKTLAQLFEDNRGVLVNDITDEQLALIGGNDYDNNNYNISNETILFEEYDTQFRNKNIDSKYKAYNGNSFGTLL